MHAVENILMPGDLANLAFIHNYRGLSQGGKKNEFYEIYLFIEDLPLISLKLKVIASV